VTPLRLTNYADRTLPSLSSSQHMNSNATQLEGAPAHSSPNDFNPHDQPHLLPELGYPHSAYAHPNPSGGQAPPTGVDQRRCKSTLCLALLCQQYTLAVVLTGDGENNVVDGISKCFCSSAADDSQPSKHKNPKTKNSPHCPRSRRWKWL